MEFFYCYVPYYSLQSSVFPDEWKRALLKPIPKITNPKSVNDFRPISLLPVISKILEKIVCEQITEFISNHALLDTYQSGFRKRHSTSTALLRISEDIRTAACNKEVTLLVLFDLSKAFDSVLHNILYSILRYLNFSTCVINWIEAYLSKRYHSVIDSDSQSEWEEIQCGVPQGSVLGPLLYSLYTFNIGSCFKYCKYHLYADDLQIYIHCKVEDLEKSIALMNDDIKRFVNWTEKHALKLNMNKTQAIVIHPQIKIDITSAPNVIVGGNKIPFLSKVKNLGVTIDENFSWSDHVSTICQKVYYTLHRLYKFRALTPIKTRKKLICSLVLPIIDYCITSCCNMNSEQVDRLQVSLNNCVRYIYNVKRREHITPYYVKLGWLKINERRDLQICVMVHKILHCYAPTYLNNMFMLMSGVHVRATRSHAMYLRSPFGMKSDTFSVMGYRLWNRLSADLCLTKNTNAFKRKVEEQLLALYSK